jgi:putative hydrolase
VSDVPQNPEGQSPEGSNPFNLDLAEFMRMLQSPDELARIMRMLQSPGPVNMEVARETAESMADVDPETGETRSEAPVEPDAAQAFDDVVRAVQLMVTEATGISAALTVPARTVDRKTWSSLTLTGLEPVFGALASALGRTDTGPGPDESGADGSGASAFGAAAFGAAFSPDMMLTMMMPLLLGGWAGSMIGLLSHRALGQFDLPLPLDQPPTLLFVTHNVDAFAHEWSLPLDELRYALALREVVHGAQRAVPWVRERLVRGAAEYVGAYEVHADEIEAQFGGFNPADPASMEAISNLTDPDALLGAMRSDRQIPLLADLQRFVSVIEGYTDVVVESIGERMVSAHVRLDEALRRHRLERGDATGFVDRLLGLELDRGHYEAGVAFCRGVMERSDGSLDQLNRIWSAESMVPTASELEAPGLWLARIDLPDAP